ncbi:MAG: hypothetical protein ACI4SS_00335 [Clostridia bacterium]
MGNYIINIITALGTVVAAISIISMFILYRIEKRDEYLSRVRSVLQMLQNNMKELNSLLNYELAFELVYTLLYTPSSQICIKRLYEVCNASILNKTDEETAVNSIRETLGVFGVSFQCELAVRYNELISELKKQSVVFYPQHKGLFRFSNACTTLMRNVFSNYKRMLLDEDYLTKIVYNTMIKDKNEWQCYEDFQKKLMDKLISVLEVGRIEQSQKDVDNLLELTDIIYYTHIELSDRDWKKLARKNRKTQSRPSKEVDTVTGDLREAEKYFRPIMNRDISNEYTSLVQKIEDRNNSD